MLASFPAGLVIYWAWNNTLSVTQQYIIMRRQGTEVNLLGNILGTFGIREKKKPVHVAGPSGKHAPAAPKAANDYRPAEAGGGQRAGEIDGEVAPRRGQSQGEGQGQRRRRQELRRAGKAHARGRRPA